MWVLCGATVSLGLKAAGPEGGFDLHQSTGIILKSSGLIFGFCKA